MNENMNPLQSHFRRPAIYLTLPSKGEFWPENALELTATGEIPVLPMTTKDEITIRTPDALLNGHGVTEVIQSCIPNIKNAWEMPSIDVDAALIAIRIASYSDQMEVDTKCPACDEDNEYNVNLHNILGSIHTPDYSTPLVVDGLSFKFRPQKYSEVNKMNLVNFEEQKVLRTINDASLEDTEKSEQFAQHLSRLIDLNNRVYVDSLESITILGPETKVISNSVYINEYIKNADRKVINQIREKIESFGAAVKIKSVPVTCGHCSHPFNVEITFDYANFFA